MEAQQMMIRMEHLNRHVGDFNRATRVFISHVKEEHIFRKYRGLGISYQVLLKLRSLGCEKIIKLLHYKDGTTEKYSMGLQEWLDNGIRYTDLEWDLQFIVPFERFEQPKLAKWFNGKTE